MLSPEMVRQQQGVLARFGVQGPSAVPPQLLLEPPRPEDIEPDLAASQSDGLTNRRMRARMSGGVGGGGATPPPTRSVPPLQAVSGSYRMRHPHASAISQGDRTWHRPASPARSPRPTNPRASPTHGSRS